MGNWWKLLTRDRNVFIILVCVKGGKKMSYEADCMKALEYAIRDLMASGIIDELRYSNLLREAELGIIPVSDVKFSPIYRDVQAKRKALSKNVKK